VGAVRNHERTIASARVQMGARRIEQTMVWGQD
jgi:hypothetical protein